MASLLLKPGMISSFIQSATGAERAEPIVFAAQSVQRESYLGWADAVRFDNRDAEVVIAPSCGRIVRFGPSEEENFLFESQKNVSRAVPDRARADHNGASNSSGFGEYQLPWPMTRWPGSFDPYASSSHDLQVISRRSIALESPLAQAFGFKLRREISLAPHGERLHVQSSLIPFEGNNRKRRPIMSVWAPWSITNIGKPTRIALRINPSTNLPGGHKSLGHDSWETVRSMGDDLLLARCPNHPAKLGCDGDLVVAEIGYYLFIQRRIVDEQSGGRDLPGEAMQISYSGDADPKQQHATIEFTGRRSQASPSLHVMWDFMSWNPTNTDSELAALVRSL